jgi:mannitol/fructose-specific phosphotransferase system IIA component (Ntr-type)
MVIQLSDYLSINRVLFTTAPTKVEVIDELIAVSRDEGKVRDVKSFKQALLKRESIMSTGIGYGVAIPHVKLPQIEGFFITIGVHKRGVNWESLDCKPVFLIFLIAGPEGDQERYLRILARLTTIIKKPEQRQRIIEMDTRFEVYECFASM